MHQSRASPSVDAALRLISDFKYVRLSGATVVISLNFRRRRAIGEASRNNSYTFGDIDKNMRDFFERLLNSGYVGLLEGEVTRLRAENRALTNSLLGTAGFPPVDFPAEALRPAAIPRLRKRSWHQTQAWRENTAKRDVVLQRDVTSSSDSPVLDR